MITENVEKYDSSYELTRFKALDSSPRVKYWTKDHGIRIVYREGKKIRTYIPDILVRYRDGRVFLEEIKGRIFDVMNFARKNVVAKSFCKRRNMTFRVVYRSGLSVVE